MTVSRETPSEPLNHDAPRRHRQRWSAGSRAELRRLRLVEGWTIAAIATLMDRTPKAIENELGRRKWVLQERRERRDAQADVAAGVARLEAEEAA